MASYEIVTQDTDVQEIFNLLLQDKAYDKTIIATSTAAGASLTGLKDLLGQVVGLDGIETTDIAATVTDLGAASSGTIADLTEHLNWHFDNLPKNLGIATSFIGDSIGFGGAVGAPPPGTAPLDTLMLSTSSAVLRAAAPAANPCDPMKNFFGSIMGNANGGIGSMLGGLTGMLGQVSNMLGGGVLGALSNIGALPGLSSIPGIGNVTGLLGNLTSAASTGQIGSILSAIGSAAPGGALGSVLQQVGSLANIGSLGSIMQGISSLAGQATSAAAGAQAGTTGGAAGGSTGGSSGGSTGGSSGGSPGGSTGGSAIPSVGSVLSTLQGLTGRLRGLMGAIGSGNIGSLVGSLGGLVQGQLGAAMKGLMGGMSGPLGKLAGMITGEKNALQGAVDQLVKMASAINLPRLFQNACGKGVLDKVGSDGLKKSLAGSEGASSGSGGSGSSGNGAGVPLPPPRPAEYSQPSVYTPSGNPDVAAVFSPTPIAHQPIQLTPVGQGASPADVGSLFRP